MKNFVRFLVCVVVLNAVSSVSAASWRPTERWRGFNIDGKSIKCRGFSGEWKEEDLAMIHEFGFNFARVMIDHRFYVKPDGRTPDPALFAPMDEMVKWGERYALHIQFCLCVPPLLSNYPKVRDKSALFNDVMVQDALVENWEYFARRYRDVSASRLSFNLFNEPNAPTKNGEYVALIDRCVRAIHAVTPDRLVVADGLNWAKEPEVGAIGMDVGQSMHIYKPSGLCSFRTKNNWPTPIWPVIPVYSPLGGKAKPRMHAPIVVENAPAGKLVIDLGLVNIKAELVVTHNGVEIFRKWLEPAGNECWKNLIKRDTRGWAGCPTAPIELDLVNSGRLTVGLDGGDWAEVKSLLFKNEGQIAHLTTMNEFGRACEPVRFAGFDLGGAFVHLDGTPFKAEDYLKDEIWKSWEAVFAGGQFVMVGEFGVHANAPHDVTLAWMEDNLKEMKRRNVGWALWNFRGDFGVMDSGRKDVTYENFRGHKLDRQMLELLQRY